MKNTLLIMLTIVFSGVSVFFRKLAVDKIHPYQIQVLAGILYGMLIPVWMYFMSKNTIAFNPNFSGNLYGILCLLSYVSSAVILGLIFKNTNAVGTMSAIVATNPLITLGLSVLFLGEEITPKKLIGSLVIVAGIGLVK